MKAPEVLSPAQISLIGILEQVYKTVNNDDRLFVIALVQSGKANDEKEANRLLQKFKQARFLLTQNQPICQD